MRGRLAPQGAVGVGRHHPTGTGTSHGAPIVRPVLRRASRELTLGRPVELPHGAGGKRRHHAMLQRLGTRRPGVGEQTKRRQIGHGAELIECSEQSLQMRRGHEGRGRAMAHDGLRDRCRIETGQDDHLSPGQQRARSEAHGSGVVHGRAHQMDVVLPKAPQNGLLAHQFLGLRIVEHPRPHALGSSRCARGVVHRTRQRRRSQLDRRSVEELLHHPGVPDDHGRIGIFDQQGALMRQQRRVQKNRDHPGPQCTQHHRQQVRRGGNDEHHTVAGMQSVCGERARGAALSIFGVGRCQTLHGLVVSMLSHA